MKYFKIRVEHLYIFSCILCIYSQKTHHFHLTLGFDYVVKNVTGLLYDLLTTLWLVRLPEGCILLIKLPQSLTLLVGC